MTIEEQIKIACKAQGISLAELGRRIGLSQPSISQRVKTGKFTQEELKALGDAMGCKYVSYFQLPDGRKVDIIG